MGWLRRSFNGIAFVISIVIGAVLCLCAIPISRIKLPTYFMQAWGKTLLRICGIRLAIEGIEHVDPARPCIYMSNHESTIDIPVLIAALPVDLRFVYKRSLGWVPFVGWAIWAMGMVPIDRANRSRAMVSLRKAGQRVKSGLPVLVFPEGTRAKSGILPFKKGGFRLALANKLDIVPITLVNSQQLCPRNSLMAKPGTLHVVIHPRVEASQYSESTRSKLMADVRERIASAKS